MPTPDRMPPAVALTARHEASVGRELRAAERCRAPVTDAAPALIWLSDADGQCYHKRWLSFTRRSMAQEVRNGWADGIHPDDQERCLLTYRRAFEWDMPFSMKCRMRPHAGGFRRLIPNGWNCARSLIALTECVGSATGKADVPAGVDDPLPEPVDVAALVKLSVAEEVWP